MAAPAVCAGVPLLRFALLGSPRAPTPAASHCWPITPSSSSLLLSQAVVEQEGIQCCDFCPLLLAPGGEGAAWSTTVKDY